MPDGSLWLAVAREVPALFCLIAVVLLFLKYLHRAADKSETQVQRVIELFTHSCATHQERLIGAVEENSRVQAEVKGVLLKLNGRGR